MDIRVLGAHNSESRNTKHTNLLIDGALALDAGALTSSLSLKAQLKLKTVLITHQHYDHLRDIPALAMNLFLNSASTSIYSTAAVYQALTTFLLNGELYPDFLKRPPGNPTIKFNVVTPLQPQQISGYTVLAVPLSHSVPAVGYQITDADGKAVFYTGDTGPGLAECWPHIAPQLLVTEVTAPDKYRDFAIKARHLTPGLLKKELLSFRQTKGYLPQVLVVHMNPGLEKEIATEIVLVAKSLNTPITLAHEGMRWHL